ncbi:MAG: 1-(5-phosphoribosyl)-5-[(5-phosphoribosylamino)methylideneamino]imidazole-4-carboxamide isomerase [bacterium]|jgi:phosphoribosylformimino-5-aminoimidazole carboxamide ribotide isomerase
MLLIPALDLKEGRCVRLLQGRPEAETVFSHDPVEVARQWERLGAQRLHIIDLDGAFAGKPQHLPVVEKIRAAVKIPLQVGGGLRDAAAVEQVLGLGVEKVILGTRAACDPGFLEKLADSFGQQIIVSVDAREGQVAVQGWQETLSLTAPAFVKQLAQRGIATIIFTDVTRDGTLQGPNLHSLKSVLGLGPQVIAAGGIATLADLLALQNLEEKGLVGAVLGKSLYTGSIDFPAALARLEKKQ